MGENDPIKRAERDEARKKGMATEPQPEVETSVPETKKDELITDKSVEDPTKGSSNQQLYWLPIGIAIGTAIGVATDNLGLWLALGVALGVILSVAGGKIKSK